MLATNGLSNRHLKRLSTLVYWDHIGKAGAKLVETVAPLRNAVHKFDSNVLKEMIGQFTLADLLLPGIELAAKSALLKSGWADIALNDMKLILSTYREWQKLHRASPMPYHEIGSMTVHEAAAAVLKAWHEMKNETKIESEIEIENES